MKNRVFGLVAMIGTMSFATTWHVEKTVNDTAAAADATGATAFLTIQAAVNKTVTGDDILVGPGVYDDGFKDATGNYGNARVGWANKVITIASTDGADKTFIRGVHSTDTAIGIGTGAVRCLGVYNGGGSIVKGFTLCNGATANITGNTGFGGCILSGAPGDAYVVACVVSNCVAYEAGVGYLSTFVRCFITENTTRNGQMLVKGASSASRANLFGCVLTHNATEANGIMLYDINIVNCTVADNIFGSCTFGDHAWAYNSVFHSSGGHSATATYVNCVTAERYPIMSTLLSDPRIIAGSVAETAGDGQYVESIITLPAAIGYTDYYGNAIPTSGTIMAGAAQVSVTPAAGGLACAVSVRVDGRRKCRSGGYSYVFPESYPTQYHVTVDAVAGRRVCYYVFNKITSLVDLSGTRFPDADDGIWVMPPPDASFVLTNTGIAMSSKLVWADPAAEAVTADGTEENPYRTLQTAMNSITQSDVVVCCKPGVYAEGAATNVTYGACRVILPSYSLRVIGVEGAENTVIMGQTDTTEDADAFGRGPAAMRCVYIMGAAQLQGFTLTGGHTDKSGERGQGGAIRSPGYDLHVSDCIITNNVAVEGGAALLARFNRCYFADNYATDFTVSYATLNACVFEKNQLGHPLNGCFGNYVRAFHTTLFGESGVNPFYTSAGSMRVNSVFVNGTEARAQGVAEGNIYWNFATWTATSGYTKANPYFADPAGSDFHPFTASAVFACTEKPTASNYGSNYWFFASTDYEGRPIIACNGGKPVAGAFFGPTDKRVVGVSAANGGLSVPDGTTPVADDGLSITAGAGTRPVTGLVVNGITNLFENLPAQTYGVTAAESTGGVAVEALYTTAWYVDAVNGNDNGLGFYAACAKRTLAAALSNANVISGDTVKALPGTYDAGSMIQDATHTNRSRAVVPAGVTLESTAGAAVTTIKGKTADIEDAPPSGKSYDMHGLGEGALRCVYLKSGARVKGFTLTDGHTRGGENHGDPDYTGGGVTGVRNQGWAENCFVTNCAAYRGAGAMAVKCVDCTFTGNFAVYGGGATSDSYTYGCLSYGNTAASWQVHAGIFFFYEVDRCTALDSLSTGADASTKVTDTLVAGTFYPTALTGATISHSAFNTNRFTAVAAGYFDTSTDCVLTDATALALDANFRPMIGANVAIDRAGASISSNLRETDLSGMQRIYNGAMDMGALEADWRGIYAADLGGNLTVPAASPAVTESIDQTVLLGGGATLDAMWQDLASRTGVYKMKAGITGNGVLTITLNGATLATLAGPCEKTEIRFVSDLATNALSFTYAAGENDPGGAELFRFSRGWGTVFSLR